MSAPTGRALREEVEHLLGEMTIEEKLGQVNMPFGVPPRSLPGTYEDAVRLVKGEVLERLGPIGGFFGLTGYPLPCGPAEQAELTDELQRLAREETRLGIPLLQIAEGCHGVIAPGTTIFPEGPALGSTFNPRLVADVYHAVAREARAVGMHMLCTLAVEPIRDPRMGRNCEAYSEDAFLGREIAFAIVAGAQAADPAAADRAAAALTVFPGQSEPVSGLERGAIELSDRVLRQAFLPAWTATSGAAGALAVMASYAAINGVPAHASEYWMTDVLRGELDFHGIVLSEGWGFETLQYEGVAETQQECGVLALRAGIDVNITWEDAYLEPLLDAIAEGLISEEYLDRAVRRVLEVKFRLGLFDEDRPARPAERMRRVRSGEHLDLALQAARDGIVLLKNDDGALPLRKDLARVAVVGPLADDGRNLLGDYVVDVVSQPVETIAAALRTALGEAAVRHERGCGVSDPDESGIAAAVAAAAEAEVAIVVLGETSGRPPDVAAIYTAGVDTARPAGFVEPATVGEPYDVSTLDLSGRQQQLLEAVHATGTPTVLVLVNGRALSVAWAAEHVPAVIEAWLPGERGAQAVCDVLFGDCEPGGRLPVTIPVNAGQLPAYYNAKRSKAVWERGRWSYTGGFADADLAPLFPFGHGLSYTTFAYADLEIDDGAWPVAVRATVTNTGDRAGSEVVQLYVRDRWSSVTTPAMELRGFAKVGLEPGESKGVTLLLEPAHLALLDARGRMVAEAGDFDILLGASSGDIRLAGEMHLSAAVPLEGGIPLAGAEPMITAAEEGSE